jgi:hypothetical protein
MGALSSLVDAIPMRFVIQFCKQESEETKNRFAQEKTFEMDWSEFFDPISFELMEDAVVTCYGHSFSKNSLIQWLETHQTCPLTKQPLKKEDLKPNYTLRDIIAKWKKQLITKPIDPKDLELGKQIATGLTSDVYRGLWLGVAVAIKAFRFAQPTAKQLEAFDNEVAISMMLKHPNLVTCYGFCHSSPKYYLVQFLKY